MTMAPLSINTGREEAIDFTKPFKTRGISVLMRTPKTAPSFFQFLKPFSPLVWICIIVSICLLVQFFISLKDSATTERRFQNNTNIQ